MTPKIFWLAMFSICLSVTAQFSFKAGMAGSTMGQKEGDLSILKTALLAVANSYVLIGFLLYGLGALVWLRVLAHAEVSKAYPLVGIGFVLTAVLGWLAGEQVSALRLLGVALICLGLCLVSSN